MTEGWLLTGDRTVGLKLEKDGNEIVFDIKISTTKGVLFCACLKRSMMNEIGGAASVVTKTMSIKTAHDLLGHHDEEKTRTIAKHLGWTISKGVLPPCKDCAAGKAKRRICLKSQLIFHRMKSMGESFWILLLSRGLRIQIG